MKRASLAAAALLTAGLTAGAAHADQQADIARDFTVFRQNALDMVMKQDFDGAKTLYEKTIDPTFKGRHDVDLILRPSADDTDVGAAFGKSGELVVSGPKLTLGFGVATNKDGYMKIVSNAANAAGDPANADAAIALPALTKNTQITPAVKSVTLNTDGTAAIVNNSLTGKINAEGVMKELGYPGLPPMLSGMDVTLTLNCDTVLKLGTAGAFTIASEQCYGKLEAVGAANLPGPRPGPHP